MTRFDAYQHAIEQLGEAAAALDQARAAMRDAEVDDVTSQRGSLRFNVRTIGDHVESLILNLNAATCENCGHPLALHDGPLKIDESEFCRWGQEDATSALFATPQLTAAWEKGKRAGEASRANEKRLAANRGVAK